MTEVTPEGKTAEAHGDPDRKGDWMQTYTGVEFYPVDPRPEDIALADVAGALSKICRYGGHSIRFYSVAEHSVLMARAAPPEHKLTALLHDASEAYLADIPRPVKPFLNNYKELEDRLMRVIAARFGIDWPLPAEVKRLDNAILHDEAIQAMTRAPRPWGLIEPPLNIKINFWSPTEASYQFTKAFFEFGGRLS